MEHAHKKETNRSMLYWGQLVITTVIMITIGCVSLTAWLYVAAIVLGGYAVSAMIMPLLVAASQSPAVSKTADRAVSVIRNMATAALISAPVVGLYRYMAT